MVLCWVNGKFFFILVSFPRTGIYADLNFVLLLLWPNPKSNLWFSKNLPFLSSSCDVRLSVYIFICKHISVPSQCDFFRPLIGPQVTWSDTTSHWSTPPPGKLSKIVSVLLSALVERFFVSRMWDFINCNKGFSLGLIIGNTPSLFLRKSMS